MAGRLTGLAQDGGSVPARRVPWLTLFAVAFGLLEAAVVVYLRELYYPGGFRFPIVIIPDRVAVVELVRELTTLLMLLGILRPDGGSIRIGGEKVGPGHRETRRLVQEGQERALALLREHEAALHEVARVLQENDGNISATARALGMHRRTLQRKLQKRPVRR